MRLYLELPIDFDPMHRARIDYAFRLFCAVYGHTPIATSLRAALSEATIRYYTPGVACSNANARTVWLSRGYCARDPREPAPSPLPYRLDGWSTVLHFAPEPGKSPDWLGEIFEWVSCADEYSVKERDRVGRPLYAATYAGRHGLDIRIPYAGLAMHALQQEIRQVVPDCALAPRAPEGAPAHVVIPTHDIDYFPVSRRHTARRLARNAVISSILCGRPALAVHQAVAAMRVAYGCDEDPLDRLRMLAEEEQHLGIAGSFNFLVRHVHRLDAGYSLEDAGVTETMHWLQARGMEIGLHGSYTSLDDPHDLQREMAFMRAHGFFPTGGRQHWLRYTLERLIPAVEDAGMEYDSSLGWSTRVGFRAGACFPFPPYEFAREGPAKFLEIPLIAMDQALRVPTNRDGETCFEEMAQLLANSRRLGWGGIALLWHPTAFGTGWLPSEVGETFWRLARDRHRWNEGWMNAGQFVEFARNRYVDAGLLPHEDPALTPEAAAQYCNDPAIGRMAVVGRARQAPDHPLRA